ncbi:MAG: 8-amino-7-oxononanoate synthase, partial [Chitinophagaceae bacterium]|nr:8-amino-7-oxononanoate synthase [Chitinophagaceae bacterium]
GAIIAGSETLRTYLINFARSFIFTTALPLHSLIAIHSAYDELMNNSFDNSYLFQLIRHFKSGFFTCQDIFLKESNSPVQSLVIPGNERVRQISKLLQARGLDVRAIVSPSVPPGKERLRISLHMHNTTEQVDILKQSLKEILFV